MIALLSLVGALVIQLYVVRSLRRVRSAAWPWPYFHDEQALIERGLIKRTSLDLTAKGNTP